MRVGIVSVYVDYHRRGRKNRLSMQPQIGPLLAGLLPRDVEIEVINETARDLDWSRDYDLLFISCLHSDFDRARQISHYWRRRGARTVFGGALASAYPQLCLPHFDALVVGDPEQAVPRLFQDFRANRLQRLYRGGPYDAHAVATPRFDLLARQAFHPLALEATRGCPFSCEFCVLTGLGTRHHARPVDLVLQDIVAGQQQLAGLPRFKRRMVGFCDNNLGGNLGYLRELCRRLAPLQVQWYAAVSFNVIANRALVDQMADAGCRCLYVGLESFNAAALSDMHKPQNVLHKVRAALAHCRNRGILVVSGLLVSPLVDGEHYIRNLPVHARAAGLHVPTFLAFETPIPGTPYFQRLARESKPAFLPNALLRDFSGYTLVVQPRQAGLDAFIDAYRDAARRLYSLPARLRKLADDLPRFLRARSAMAALFDIGDMAGLQGVFPPAPGRTLLAGSDTPPPETVPFTEADFTSEQERESILAPWAVTDAQGRALPHWSNSHGVFRRQGSHPPPSVPADLTALVA